MNKPLFSVVLGAGLMGRMLAHALAQIGHRVQVHEALGEDGQGSAARVAAAMLAPLAESAITEMPVVRMGHHGLTRWPELIAALPEPVFFQQNGTLVLWHRQDAAEAKRFEGLLLRTQDECPELTPIQRLDAQGLQKMEPGMEQRFNQALYLPGEGQLDNRELLASLLKGMAKLGVEVRWNSPASPDDFHPGQSGQPDWVFDCRGLGARQNWTQLRGVRGEVLRLYAPDVDLQRPTRLIHPRYPIYIAPKENHVFVIGATEIETEDLSAVSVRSTLELLSAAYTVHSGFAEARILEASTQARPTLIDNLPAIRCLGERALQINGLYRHGFLISPAMLDVVMEWVQHQTTSLATQFNLKFQHA